MDIPYRKGSDAIYLPREVQFSIGLLFRIPIHTKKPSKAELMYSLVFSSILFPCSVILIDQFSWPYSEPEMLQFKITHLFRGWFWVFFENKFHWSEMNTQQQIEIIADLEWKCCTCSSLHSRGHRPIEKILPLSLYTYSCQLDNETPVFKS